MPQGIVPDFLLSDCFFFGHFSERSICSLQQTDTHARALVNLLQRGLHTLIPSIHMANLRSLGNRLDEPSLLNSINKNFSLSAVLTKSTLDSTLHSFNLYRADRSTELSGKQKDGGICFYVNKGWCTDVTALTKTCSPNLE